MNIISSALELRDEGIDPPIEELCLGHEELVPAVREALGLASELPRMQIEGPRRDDHLGRILCDRYRLDQRLGAGAMGVVYAAEDLELGRSVAVKILRTDVLGAEEATARFLREAEVMAVVKHPAVITVHDRGTTQSDEHFLVMELLEGESLSQLLEQGRRRTGSHSVEDTDWIARALECEEFPQSSYLRTVVQWAADLAGGLGAAHRAGVFHRDVKPSNVFIQKDGSALLLDFGIAASTEHATLMRDSGALGTPAYMAPESLNPDQPASAALDVYSLSATLYHMLVMRAPYAGTPSQIIASVKDHDPKPAYRLRKGLPRDLQAILDRGMARRPAQRYTSAEDLETDLRAFLDYRPVSARPVTLVGRTWRRLRRSPAFFAAASVALLAVAFVVGKEGVEYRDTQREAHYLDAYEVVTPSLTLGPPLYRKQADAVIRAETLDVLDRLVEFRAEPIHPLSLRAAFLLDQGEARRAANDMRLLASELGSPYSQVLAERYAALADDAEGAYSLDLEGLPEPETAGDLFLAATHVFRAARSGKDMMSISTFLEDPKLSNFAPAQEMLIRLNEFLNESLPDEEKTARSLESYESAVRVEEKIGRRTASTAKLIGTTLVTRELYAEAIDFFREAISLAEYSYGSHLNLGVCARRLRLREESERHLKRAIELCPTLIDPHVTLIRLHIEFGETSQARQRLLTAPFSDGRKGRAQELNLEADIEFPLVLDLYRSGKAEAAQEAAGRCVELYEEARVLLNKSKATPEQEICVAILSDDPSAVAVPLLSMLEDEPLRWRRLGTFLEWLPAQLNEEATLALGRFLQKLKLQLQIRGD